MTRSTRSITGLALSIVVGATYSLPAFAQSSTPANLNLAGQKATSISQSPLPPSLTTPTVPASPPNVDSAGGQLGESYVLGPGDVIRINVNLPRTAASETSLADDGLVFLDRYIVLPDGSVNLPWVNSIQLAGLSLQSASDRLEKSYRRFIKNPLITLNLLAPRPLKIGVIGEVNRPGSYLISVISNEVTQASLNQRTTSEGGNQFPRVSQAIQTAGGITQLANLREVRLKRIRGNTEELIAIDLFRFLREGDQNQDRLLKDGDVIVIPKATQFDSAEAYEVAQSNFSPATINVNVVGEVFTPGARPLRPNSTLNQAILAAGGFRGGRASSKKVDLIRLNPNGTVTRKRFNIDLDQNMNDERNPRLFDNDIVVVNRTFIAAADDFLRTAFGVPLQIFGGISGFRNLLPPVLNDNNR
jgi:polysaccharide biosynthesis/export protein